MADKCDEEYFGSLFLFNITQHSLLVQDFRTSGFSEAETGVLHGGCLLRSCCLAHGQSREHVKPGAGLHTVAHSHS